MRKGIQLMVFCVIFSFITANYSFGSTPATPENSVIKPNGSFSGEHERVESIALSRDGSLVASGGDSIGDSRGTSKNETSANRISLWSTETGQLLRKLVITKKNFAVIRPHDLRTDYYVQAMAFSPDGKFLASGGSCGIGVKSFMLTILLTSAMIGHGTPPPHTVPQCSVPCYLPWK